MAQSQIQEQKLEQRLQQSVSQLQLLQAQLIEMPVTQLVERIETEMNDNPALETRTDDDGDWHDDLAEEGGTDDDFDTQREREERQSALDEALQGIGRDDEDLPVYHGGSNMGEASSTLITSFTATAFPSFCRAVGGSSCTRTAIAV